MPCCHHANIQEHDSNLVDQILKLLPLPANTPHCLTIYCIEIIFDTAKVLKFAILTKIQGKVFIAVG
jgi:hypothetical protein